jgi:hypothetical protein
MYMHGAEEGRVHCGHWTGCITIQYISSHLKDPVLAPPTRTERDRRVLSSVATEHELVCRIRPKRQSGRTASIASSFSTSRQQEDGRITTTLVVVGYACLGPICGEKTLVSSP